VTWKSPADVLRGQNVEVDRGVSRNHGLAIVMTNDPDTNAIKVYDTRTHALVQTLSTHGKGGVGGNAQGVRQYSGAPVAVVNNGSNTVAVFRREGNGLGSSSW
jgi:hypothetical protein